MAWTNGDWGPHKPEALIGARTQTSGTLGSRVIEARISWQTLENALDASRQPGYIPNDPNNSTSLVEAVGPCFVFGCDPRLCDLDGLGPAGPFTATAGGSWLNGNGLWGTPPTGNDMYSVDIKLVVDRETNLNDDRTVNNLDMAEFAAQWGRTDCSHLNNWCDGADLTGLFIPGVGYRPDNNVDILDLQGFIFDDWLETF
jgi:hypothetical protein